MILSSTCQILIFSKYRIFSYWLLSIAFVYSGFCFGSESIKVINPSFFQGLYKKIGIDIKVQSEEQVSWFDKRILDEDQEYLDDGEGSYSIDDTQKYDLALYLEKEHPTNYRKRIAVVAKYPLDQEAVYAAYLSYPSLFYRKKV